MLAAAMAMTLPARAAEVDVLTVWLDAQFDESGKLASAQAQDEAEHPPAFWAQLRSHLAEARIEPMRLADGQAARLRTGLAVSLRVDRGAGAVTIGRLLVSPLALRRSYAGYPRDIARVPGWSGDFGVECTVGVEGRCLADSIEVAAVPGIPDSLRRWARVTLSMWEFQPQQLNGVPIEGRYRFSGVLKTQDALPRDFREPRKL